MHLPFIDATFRPGGIRHSYGRDQIWPRDDGMLIALTPHPHGPQVFRQVTTNTLMPEMTRAPRWPTLIAVALLLVFIAMMPQHYHFIPSRGRPWALALVMVLAIASAQSRVSLGMRRAANVATALLVVLLTAMLLAALGMVVKRIYVEGVAVRGVPVLSTTAALWATNIVVFALWYWLVDRGGPERRASGEPKPIDFLFPQNAAAEIFPTGWTPRFADYLFVAFVTSTAFSPADTLPVSARAKLLMMAQAILSLVTLVLIVGRAINVLE